MAIKISGVTIIDDSRNIVSGAAATFTSNVTIGGTLTYEDVTNIDSVGVITAREGISIPNLKGINLGDSNELNIINSNNSAFIQHSGSGYLFIHGNDIALRSQAQKNYIVCDADNEVSLFFNGNEKLRTTNTGVEVVHAGGGVLNVTSINATDGDYAGIVTAQGFVGGGINTLSESIFKDMSVLGGINISGVATANAFSGDGSNLTNLPVSSFFTNTDVGIHTLAKVGIGTTNPIAQLDVNVGTSVTALNIEGSEGQLFSVTNNLSSGSIFAVNDITGLPSIDVNADGTIQLAPRGAGELVGIGTTVPTSKLHVVGTLTAEKYKGDTNRNIIMGVDPNTVATSGVGTGNVFIGDSAGTCNTDGRLNVFIGNEAGKLNTTSTHNVAIGNRAGCCLKTGGSNTILGTSAGHKLCSGTSNVFLGSQAALCATTTSNSVVIGLVAGKSLTTGTNNVLVGRMAGCQMHGGSSNVMMGNCAGYCAQGHNNVMLGSNSGFHRAGSKYNYNTILGNYAGRTAGTLAVGNFDVLLGYLAGECYTGTCSIGIGHSLRMPITAGTNQLAIGQETNYWITGSCDYNVGIGISIPTSKLHVVGNTFLSGISTFSDDVTFTGATSNVVFDKSDNSLEFAANSKIKLHGGSYMTTLHSDGVNAYLCHSGLSAFFMRSNDFQITGSGVRHAGLSYDGTIFRARTGIVELGYEFGNGDAGIKLRTSGIGITVTGQIDTTDINASGIVTAQRYSGDSDCNIIMGNQAGIAVTPASTDVCGTVVIGCCAAMRLRCGGNSAVFIGRNAGQMMNCSEGSVFIGQCAGCDTICGQDNILIGRAAGSGGGACGDKTRNTIGQGFNRNVFIGNYAGRFNRHCCGIMIGAMAGQCMRGAQNVVMGTCAAGGNLASTLADASFNVILGAFAGNSMKGGSENIFLGRGVGASNSGAGANIMMGCAVGACNLTGGSNIYMGSSNTGNQGTTAHVNIFLGGSAGRCVTTGRHNIAIGNNAYRDIGSGEFGIAIGDCAGKCSTIGANVLVGRQSGCVLTQNHNTFIGDLSGIKSKETCGSTFVGMYAGGCNTTGNRNTYLGCRAGIGNTTGGHNINIGAMSGPQTCGATGDANIFMGRYAGRALTGGTCNIALGYQAGNCITTGVRNILFGRNSGQGVTSGTGNFSVGNHAGPTTCGFTGIRNISLGENSMRLSTGGALCNITVGVAAGYCATGNHNLYIGSCAGSDATSGSYNIAIGCDVQLPSATGSTQLAIGCNSSRWIQGDSSFNVCLAGAGVTATAAGTVCSCRVAANKYLGDCNSNVIFGGMAGLGVTLSNNIHHNVLLGCIAGYSLSTQCHVIAIGKNTAKCVHTGAGQHVIIGGDAGRYVGDLGCSTYGNVLIGINAGHCQVGACANVSIGVEAGRSVHGCSQMHCDVNIGYRAGCLVKGGYNNVRIGRLAGVSNSTGIDNITIGNVAGYHNITGSNNIVMGESAGYCFCTGGANILLGSSAGKCGVSQSAQVIIGNGAGFNQDGDLNTIVGYAAMRCSGVAQGNVAIGACAMCGATAPGSSTGCCNIGIGYGVANKMSSGNRNTVVGAQAGSSLTTGSYNILFGMNSGQNLTTGSRNIVIGSIQAPSATGSNTLTIGCCACTWIKGDSSYKVTLAGIVTATAGGAVCANSTTLKAYAVDTDIFSITRSDHASSKLFRIFQDSNSGGGAGGPHINTFNRNLMITASASAATNSGVYLKTTGEFGVGTNNPTSKLHVAGDVCVSGVSTFSDTLRVGAGVTLNRRGDAAFAGVVTFSAPTTVYNGNGAIHLPNCRMITFGQDYIRGAIYQAGAQLTFQALNAYKFCVWDGGGFADWLNVAGPGGQITLGGCSMGVTGSTNKTHMFRLNKHKITMCSSLPDSSTQTKRFELDSHGIQLTGITTIAGNVNVTGVVTATHFYGDGSNLTGISGGGGISTTFFASSAAGIHTLSKVGIGTAIPEAQLDVNVGSGVTALNISGSEGQLFSVTNNLTSGSIFEVNDVSGMPSIDVDADGTIQLAPHGTGELVGIGTTVPTSKLHVAGDTLVTGISTFSDDINLPNDKKVKFGSFGFQMYQNTSASNNAVIEQSASGQFLRLVTNGGALSLESDYINMRNSANNANVASFDADGAANLRFNSNLKFFTKTDGAGVIGILTANGLAVTSGVSTFTTNLNLTSPSGTDAELRVTRTGGAALLIDAHTANGVFETTTNHKLTLRANSGANGSSLVIDTAGNMGLGAEPGGSPVGNTDHFFAIGDSDTGIAQDGDGQFEIWANNTEIANFNTGGITFTKALNLSTIASTVNFSSKKAGLGVVPSGTPNGLNAFFALGDNDTGIGQDGDGQLEIWANTQEIIHINTSEVQFNKPVDFGQAFNLLNENPSWNSGVMKIRPSTNGGASGITFQSSVNYNSDFGYLWWYDDNNNYADIGSTSSENGTLILGVQNDAGGNGDNIAIEATGDIYLNSGTSSGLTTGLSGPDFTRGRVFIGRGSNRHEVYHSAIGIITASSEIHVGTGVTIESNGQATFVGVVTFGSSSTTIDGNSDTINVGTALTIGHSQGLQFHTQNLHSTGFEVNNINATGIITATNFTKTDGTPIASTDIAINTLSSSSGTGGGSASFNGTAYRFTLSEPPDTSVYQLQVSINGVIQKPNAGSSQPSEGFAIDGNDIIFGSPPPAGSPFFITTFKTVGISSIPPQAQVKTTSAAKSVKNVTTSTSAPTNSNGVDGDLWFTYIA